MAVASVEDSDVDEPFSPVANAADRQTLIEDLSEVAHTSSLKTLSTDLADEFGIAPTSPTRQHLRRSQSTTMEKLQNKGNAYSQSTTLDSVTRRIPVRAGLETTEDAAIEVPAASFLSRDGDLVACSELSMSTPDFGIACEMLPPTSTKQSSSGNATTMLTQPLSEYENPLQVLIQPQVSDGLPSTKPSSESLATNIAERQTSTSETQDDLAAAAQIGSDLLANMLDPRFAEETMFGGVRKDENQDELTMDPAAPQYFETSKASRKRARSTIQDQAEENEPPKKRHQALTADEDLFSGLPAEHYQPRKSRSRAAPIDNSTFADVYLSNPLKEKNSNNQNKISRRKTTGGAVVVHTKDEDDLFDEVEEELFTPAKSRIKKNGKTRKSQITEDIAQADVIGGLSQHSVTSSGTSDAVIIVAAKEAQEEKKLENTARKSSKKTKTYSKKNKLKQKVTEDDDALTNDEIVAHEDAKARSRRKHTIDGSNPSDIEQKQAVAPTLEVITETDITTTNEEQISNQTDLQAVSRIDNTAHEVDDPVEESMKQVAEAKKAKGKGRKRAGSKKSAVQVLTLPSSPPSESVLNTVSEIDAIQVATAENTLAINEEQLAHTSQESKSQPLSDKTNLTTTEKDVTPSKPGTNTVHSPIRSGRVPYRVGLSRRSRIEPLLKIIRKEKDIPKEPVSKKKKT